MRTAPSRVAVLIFQRRIHDMAEANSFSNVRFLTVAEVADVMRVSKMTVYRMAHSGELPAIRFGRSFRVPENAVNEHLGSLGIQGSADSA
ncbi:hypothetical transcriptional regulatory protein [Renibacterium salmoninarum ATCC 33209]|uniref:Hypothetical transcriptional regulatory protein n=2 Tax=Renibacterium salmoninarum TaxID=1646 RepID=A9WTC1_RENSM|nr:hypothetical transcriptional regulatory protein [Renibacterium salmoninarum ATCC 33209]